MAIKIRKKKRNPKNLDNTYVSELAMAYVTGDPFHLANSIIYKKQGYKCDDCGLDYKGCDCEGCDDCGFPRCLCDLDLPYPYYNPDNIVKKETKNIIQKKVLEIVNKLPKDLRNRFYAEITV